MIQGFGTFGNLKVEKETMDNQTAVIPFPYLIPWDQTNINIFKMTEAVIFNSEHNMEPNYISLKIIKEVDSDSLTFKNLNLHKQLLHQIISSRCQHFAFHPNERNKVREACIYFLFASLNICTWSNHTAQHLPLNNLYSYLPTFKPP